MLARRTLGILSLSAFCAAAAEPVHVLSGGALEPAIAAVLTRWRAEGGSEVTVTYATTPRISERLAAGETPHLVIAPVALIQGLEQAGKLAAVPVAVGSVGVGIAVRESAAVPAIRDEASLRAELRAAEAVVFNGASTGLYIDRLLDRLGLTAEVAPKAVRFPTGEEVLHRIAAGSGREIAFAAMTEIALFRGRGVHLVGPLPDGLQNRTAYAAGLLVKTSGDEAGYLLAFLASPTARTAMAEAGVE
jgi:molybdate transport system substrate-binding protein